MMKALGYLDLFKEYGIPIESLKKRRFLLQLTPDAKDGKVVKFSPEQVYQILMCVPQDRLSFNHPRKLKLISLYSVNKNIKSIAGIVGVNHQYAFDVIKEYKTGEITVKSSMNDPKYLLEEKHGEYYLYDDEENLMASTEKIQNFYLLNKNNIEAHLSFRRESSKKGRYKVDICSTDREDEEIPWIKNRTITIRNISPSN